MRIAFLFSLFLVFYLPLSAQNKQVLVKGISITGNKKTKEKIILREMDIHLGDSILIQNLQTRIEENQLYLLNTSLFTHASINISKWDEVSNEVHLKIELKEAWYVYPFFTVELADRNFNVWWVDQKRDLARLNFGLRFYYVNFTGQRDLLKLVLQYGYTRKVELQYTLPYFNKSQTLGVTTNFLYTRNKEMGYVLEDNRLLFTRQEDKVLLKRLRTGLGLIYRPGQKFFHRLEGQYSHNNIEATIATDLNPNFFLDNRETQQFLSLAYRFSFDSRDIRPYPLTGNFLYFDVAKEGLGIFGDLNTLKINGGYAQYLSFSKKISLEASFRYQWSLIRKKQPFFNYRALGYDEEYVRGYEYYVVNGLDYGLMKTSFRYELLNREFNWGKSMPLKQFKKMPFKLYLTLNNDLGYVNDPYFNTNNDFGNRVLWGGGLGIDFVLYYDKVLQFEYSYNHLGENGLFLHFKLSF